MTWSEFCIRLFAYQRLDKKEWYKVRLIAYQIYVSNWQNPKKKPVSIEKFMSLETKKKPKLTEAQQNAIKYAVEQYDKQKNGTA
jgi:hypothetical protein